MPLFTFTATCDDNDCRELQTVCIDEQVLPPNPPYGGPFQFECRKCGTMATAIPKAFTPVDAIPDGAVLGTRA